MKVVIYKSSFSILSKLADVASIANDRDEKTSRKEVSHDKKPNSLS